MQTKDASDLLNELIARHTGDGYETEPRVPVSVLREFRDALAHSDRLVGQMRRHLEVSRREGHDALNVIYAVKDTADEMAAVCAKEGDNKGAGALQYISGYISDRMDGPWRAAD